MVSLDTVEDSVLHDVLSQFEAEGFDVFVNPSGSILPSFMGNFRPDAVAINPDKKIAFEVVRENRVSADELRRLEALFAAHRDWELRVLYVAPRSSGALIGIAGVPAIESALRRVSDLRASGQLAPALIMAWSALEAVARALLPNRFARAQTPARLVETLASDGYLTPREADTLRAAILSRNAAVHGDLEVRIEEKQLDDFVAILRSLAGYLSKNLTSQS